MENTINKTKKSRVAVSLKAKEMKKIISEEDIRNRAFEIYLGNENSSSTEQDNWFHAESELSGHHN